MISDLVQSACCMISNESCSIVFNTGKLLEMATWHIDVRSTMVNGHILINTTLSQLLRTMLVVMISWWLTLIYQLVTNSGKSTKLVKSYYKLNLTRWCHGDLNRYIVRQPEISLVTIQSVGRLRNFALRTAASTDRSGAKIGAADIRHHLKKWPL